MAVGEKVFHVLTEFSFETQSALAKTGVLQMAVGKLASTADDALISFKNLGGYLMSGLGLGLSVTGILGGAVKASENLTKNSLAFANIMGGNLDKLQGDVGTFNDRVMLSKQIMKDISKISSQFSLPESQLLSSAKMMSAMLVPKGLAGNNFSNAIDMARMFEKSAPILGVDTQQSQGELIRMIEGNASMNDTLFRRLLSETKAFAGLREVRGAGAPTKAFNSMDMVKRFGMIQAAMHQFSSDADVNSGMASLLSNKFQVLKDKLFGINSVLIPLGNAIVPALRRALDYLITWIDTKGRIIIAEMAKGLKALADNPEAAIASLMQIKELLKDLGHAGTVTQVMGMAMFATSIYKMAMYVPFLNKFLTMVVANISTIASQGMALLGGMSGMRLLSVLGMAARGSFMLLGFALRYVLFPLMLVVAAFQLISRALAYAKINDATALAENAGSIAEAVSHLTSAFALLVRPFYDLFDGAARLLAPLFQINHYIGPMTFFIELLATVIEWAGMKINLAYAAIYGGILGVMDAFTRLGDFLPVFAHDVLNSLPSLLTGGAGDFTASKQMFSDSWTGISDVVSQGMEEIFSRNIGSLSNPEGDRNVANHVTHIGKVEVRQDFKENMEPDRIASSLVKTLSAIAKNPTQSMGRSIQGPLLGAN